MKARREQRPMQPLPVAYIHRGITKEEAVKLLADVKINGTFLVRESETVANTYVLCVFCQKQVHQYRIMPDRKTGFLWAQGAKTQYLSPCFNLDDLIQQFIALGPRNGLVCPLQSPVLSNERTQEIYHDSSSPWSGSDAIKESERAVPFTENDTVKSNVESESHKERERVFPFSVNDKVKINVTFDQLKQLQQDHGGWKQKMKNILNDTGLVLDIDGDGDLVVQFAEEKFTLNPAACINTESAASEVQEERQEEREGPKQSEWGGAAASRPKPCEPIPTKQKFTINDQVKIKVTMGQLKLMQHGHGGWQESMQKAIGTVGLLTGINQSGDLRVQFPVGTLILNPAACISLDPAKPSPNPAPSPDDTSTSGTCPFEVDEQVKVSVKEAKLRELQRGHGGWSPDMKQLIGAIGIVKEVTSDGEVRVKFSQGLFTLNPSACVSLSVDKQKSKQPDKGDDDDDDDIVTADYEGRDEWKPKDDFECRICMVRRVEITLGCGHLVCSECVEKIAECHFCREPITSKIKMFTP